MYCGNCGSFMHQNATFCPNCGVAGGHGTVYCSNCGTAAVPGAAFCSNCGVWLHGEVPAARKSRLVAGLLGVFLGSLGVHNFYLGYTSRGIAQIVVTLFSAGIGSLWGFIEGVLLLCGKYKITDSHGLYLDK